MDFARHFATGLLRQRATRELGEMALAHTIENKVEAAYRRGDPLQKRAEMMNDWASYIAPLRLKKGYPQ